MRADVEEAGAEVVEAEQIGDALVRRARFFGDFQLLFVEALRPGAEPAASLTLQSAFSSVAAKGRSSGGKLIVSRARARQRDRARSEIPSTITSTSTVDRRSLTGNRR